MLPEEPIRAFRVTYKTGGSQNTQIVMARNEEDVPYKLAEKDLNFDLDSQWSTIEKVRDIPLSTVKVSDLSIVELKVFLNG